MINPFVTFRILLIHKEVSKDYNTWLSWLIQVVTKGRYNHVAIEVFLYGEFYILESIRRGVLPTPYDEWVHLEDRDVLPLTPLHEHTINIHDLLRLIGKPYSIPDLVMTGIYILLKRWFNWDIKIKFNGKGFTCVELSSIILRHDRYLSPSQLAELPNVYVGKEFKTYKK